MTYSLITSSKSILSSHLSILSRISHQFRGYLVSFQAEIKRLKAANRAASYERRLLLMQQEEIARLRKNTKKIREKAATEQTTHAQERGEKTAQQDVAEQPKVRF